MIGLSVRASTPNAIKIIVEKLIIHAGHDTNANINLITFDTSVSHYQN